MSFHKSGLKALLASATIIAVPFAAEARELRMGLIPPPSHVWTKVAHEISS